MKKADEGNSDFQEPDKTVNVLFGGLPTRRSQKATRREVLNINSTAGCDLLYFLDCYSGYHQIAIKEEDQEKTAFITPFGAYCYTTMSFALKNACATYQQAIQAYFKRQLNKNVKAYVDDVVVKTRNYDTLIADLEETFASLRESSASSAYCRENYSASSSTTAASKPTPRRSPPSPT
jgi:hypothetical protein